jgi:tetratricopeptide (TPR) repeat protein
MHSSIFTIIGVLFYFFLMEAGAQDISSLLEKADDLDSHESKDAAIEILKQAENISPNNPQVLIHLSEDYSDKVDLAKGQSQKLDFARLSLDYAKRAIKEAPGNSAAHASLSIAYGKMTDFVGNRTKIEYSKIVKAEAEKSVELDPKNDSALLVLARWNFDMATLNPILKGLAQMIYGQLPPASKEKAIDYFQRAIAVAPDRILYRAQYAEALEAQDKAEKAKIEWRKIAQLKPTDNRERQYQTEAARKAK